MDIRSEQENQIQGFLKRMGWPVNSTSDEARVKWNIAMKFLIPVKFDVNRAITLYRTHENIRKSENLDHIWINNLHLIREIQSNKFFSLPFVPNQPLVVCFTASNFLNSTSSNTISQQDKELFALQALVCQLDVATESLDVQQNGLNFIYDMQNCSASQFDMNLSKKVLKLLQGGYPAMVKNIFIISAPKWFKIAYKVLMYTPDQMREILLDQYNYTLDHIPISFGGLFDPTNEGGVRYQTCLSTVTNSQSICSAYYTQEYQPITTKSTSNILFFNTDHHPHHQQQNSDGNSRRTSSPTSLVAIVALRRNHDSAPNQSAAAAAAAAVRKRQSSSSSDSEKRRRSNESLIQEEEPIATYIPQEISFNQLQSKNTLSINENSLRTSTNQQEKKIGMSEYDSRDGKRTINKLSNTNEFLAKTQTHIRQEYRKLPNPPAKDTRAAKDERNLNKSRYRDVIPGEATRVKLQPDSDDKNDFINANYVSGCDNQEKAYIFTQGPLESTVKDFWRMVWQENIAIIVMTTNIRESNTIKCYPYWPSEAKSILNAGLYQIQNEESEKYPSFIVTKLSLRKKNNSEIRTIYHTHYIKWPDHGIPPNTNDALDFLERVNYYKRLTQTQAPILLHCSAGIGRTGTFCAIDIGIKRYLEKKNIDMPATVMKMRNERAGSVQTEDQYVFAHLALMDYIKQNEQTTADKDLPDINDDVKVQDNRNSLVDLDDNTRKARTKKQSKKSSDLGATNTLPTIHSSKNTNSQDITTSQRGKTLSDSHVSSIQFVTPSTTTQQNDSTTQRLSTEYNSSIPPTATGNINHKKVRK